MTKNKLVYGVGINDADYKVTRREYIDGKSRQTWLCPFYRTWKHMLERCYCESFQKRYPTYYGCKVTEEWHLFSRFKEWMQSQDYIGKQLDKDFLSEGNKVYCPENCIFISAELNKFLGDRKFSTGNAMTGISWVKRLSKFQAMCNNPFTGKNEHLGLFNCAENAHVAWKSRKHKLACYYAEMNDDARIVTALLNKFSEERAVYL